MKFIWIEIVKFIRNNIVKLVLGTSIIAIIFAASSYINSYQNMKPKTENIEDVEEIVGEEENGDNDLVELYFETEPANFYFFVETIDQIPFTNNLLLEQYITSPKFISEVSIETDTDLSELVESTGNNANVDYTESGETKIIAINRNGNTHLLEFYVNVGDEEDNVAIANYIFELVTNKEIELLNNKQVYYFQEPQIKEISQISTFDDNTSELATNEFNFIREIIIGFIIGGIVSLGLLLLMSFISKTLKYAFSYSINQEDYFLLVDKKLDYRKDLEQLLLRPTTAKIVVLNEDNKVNKYIENIVKINKVELFNNITDITNIQEIDRLIYIVNEGSTSRNWYNKQKRMERNYNVPVVVIQFNDI